MDSDEGTQLFDNEIMTSATPNSSLVQDIKKHTIKKHDESKRKKRLPRKLRKAMHMEWYNQYCLIEEILKLQNGRLLFLTERLDGLCLTIGEKINSNGVDLQDLDPASLARILLVNQLARFMYTNLSLYEYFEVHRRYYNSIIKCGFTHDYLRRQEDLISDAK